MKITDINAKENVAQYVQNNQAAQETRQVEREKQAAAEQSQATDKVELSAASRDIQKIQEVLKNTPDVRAEKVQELKSKIESGQYRVDAREIANKMVSNLIQDLA
ncbi:MAG: flagellar biosynthesis anti-sigma factor FlgM [Thermodesulfobacteriota bacterium]|nr:flagellar biosynthesis anti-sigma factor FlgM [Thermodesulfobacteriota bacterium]MDP3030374.1 flagellar biosynthesis anti-sigma factor FlgM [Deltaproteobacteria bacterium]